MDAALFTSLSGALTHGPGRGPSETNLADLAREPGFCSGLLVSRSGGNAVVYLHIARRHRCSQPVSPPPHLFFSPPPYS
jgi:hypothetical protein